MDYILDYTFTGKKSSPDISTGQYFASNTPYIQYFFQPQLGVRNKNLEVSYALRLTGYIIRPIIFIWAVRLPLQLDRSPVYGYN